MGTIYHIVSKSEWAAAKKMGVYMPPSLTEEGFIHCSTRDQVAGTANLIFRGQSGLALLQIEEENLDKPVIYEDLYDAGQAFPHIYDSLKPHQVSAVLDFPAQEDGTFHFPD